MADDDSQRGIFGTRGERPKIDDETMEELENYLRVLNPHPKLSCYMGFEEYKELILSR